MHEHLTDCQTEAVWQYHEEPILTIKEYTTVVYGIDDAEFFNSDINRLIKEGWQPYGRVQATHNYKLVQTMVKYAEK